MSLFDLYKEDIIHFEEEDFKGEKVKVRLMMDDDQGKIQEFLENNEFKKILGFYILDENNKPYSDTEKEVVFDKMPVPHMKELQSLIFKVNGVGVDMVEKKSD